MIHFSIIITACALAAQTHFVTSSTVQVYNITVYETVKHDLAHFWESTGFCPPQPHQDSAAYFLSSDMKQNLLHTGSVPHQGIKQVRMHWLLDLIKINSISNDYDFSSLDDLLMFMKDINLKPGFELMGNPSNKFSNFDDKQQVFEWMDLVSQIADRYIKLFGIDWVKKWNFETWNEPDDNDFDVINVTVNGFLNYYDACNEGLKRINPEIIFGGPGAACRKESFSKICYALLKHCINGTNYITGKKGTNIDFISFHKKGKGMARYLIQDELVTMDLINKDYTELSKLPIFNDEADPLVGWSKPLEWRADATYGAVALKIISQHQNMLIANPAFKNNYALLGNDNGFLSFYPHQFTQRTLLARFQINNTAPHHVHLVKKPIMGTMMFLSKLGTKQLHHTVEGNPDQLGAISSICQQPDCTSTEITLLMYNSADTSLKNGTSVVNITFEFQKLNPNTSTYIMQCAIDNLKTNPYMLWNSMGSPDYPTPTQFITLHKGSQPDCIQPKPLKNFLKHNNKLSFLYNLNLPGISLHHICYKPLDNPAAAINLKGYKITSGIVLLTWDYPVNGATKCIKTFRIQFKKQANSALTSLNLYNTLYESYTVISPTYNDDEVQGVYYVVTVDFWGRESQLSNAFVYQ